MNKMWLSLLLVPCLGFALVDEEEESLVSSLEEEMQETENEYVKQNPYHKEPSYCAYCGSHLIAQADKQVATVKKRSTPQVGTQPRARSKIHENSNRPRVTQRKPQLDPQSAPRQQEVSEQSALTNEETERASASLDPSLRPQVVQRKQLGAAVQMKPGRFVQRAKKSSATLSAKPKRKAKVASGRPLQRSKAQIRESMSQQASD